MTTLLKHARLSFPEIWEPKAFANEEKKFSAIFLLDKVKDADQIAALRAQIAQIMAERLPGSKLKPDAFCMGDGDAKGYDGYAGMIWVKASSKKRPTIVDQSRSPLVEADHRPYAGCYVNGAIELWAQDNQFGKRINAWLNGIQFVADGEPFGSSFDVNEFPEIEKPQDYVTEAQRRADEAFAAESAPVPDHNDPILPF